MLNDNADKIVWSATENGNFSLTSAWELVRTRSISFNFSKFCWHKYIPLKISIFLWCLLHKTLATDMAVKGNDISIVSKCVCCSTNPQSESATHLFATLS